jgi:hypothetical protein
MSLHVLAYNLKRVMKIMGTGAMIEALRALSTSDRHLAGSCQIANPTGLRNTR